MLLIAFDKYAISSAKSLVLMDDDSLIIAIYTIL